MTIARSEKMDEMWKHLLLNIEDSKVPPKN